MSDSKKMQNVLPDAEQLQNEAAAYVDSATASLGDWGQSGVRLAARMIIADVEGDPSDAADLAWPVQANEAGLEYRNLPEGVKIGSRILSHAAFGIEPPVGVSGALKTWTAREGKTVKTYLNDRLRIIPGVSTIVQIPKALGEWLYSHMKKARLANFTNVTLSRGSKWMGNISELLLKNPKLLGVMVVSFVAVGGIAALASLLKRAKGMKKDVYIRKTFAGVWELIFMTKGIDRSWDEEMGDRILPGSEPKDKGKPPRNLLK